jgi:hypothetical protein
MPTVKEMAGHVCRPVQSVTLTALHTLHMILPLRRLDWATAPESGHSDMVAVVELKAPVGFVNLKLPTMVRRQWHNETFGVMHLCKRRNGLAGTCCL